MAITLKIKTDRDGTQYLEMSKEFARLAANTASEQYRQLQGARRDYPEAKVITRSIRKKPNQDHFKGLSYDFMSDYILVHEPKETRVSVLKEFDEMKIISQCHSKAFRYPLIKNWFLEKYPEVNGALIAASAKESTADAASVLSETEKNDLKEAS